MQESSGKVPTGFFGSGNFHSDGLFDECLDIQSPNNFTGKYCTIFLKPLIIIDSSEITNTLPLPEAKINPLITMLQALGLLINSSRVKDPKVSKADPMSYVFPSISMCLPSSCGSSDIGQVVAQLIGSYVFAGNLSIVTVADDNYCFVKSGDNNLPTFDAPDIAVL